MDLLTTSLFAGIAALYLGFAGVMGVLLHRARRIAHARPWWLVTLHGVLILLPATILVLGFEAWPSWASLALFVGGIATIALGAIQPAWIPESLWGLAFGQRYFALAMLLAALWGLSFSLSSPALVPAAVGAAALAAALASITKSPSWS